MDSQPSYGVKLEKVGVICPVDIHRTANILMKRHGQDTPVHAGTPADAIVPF